MSPPAPTLHQTPTAPKAATGPDSGRSAPISPTRQALEHKPRPPTKPAWPMAGYASPASACLISEIYPPRPDPSSSPDRTTPNGSDNNPTTRGWAGDGIQCAPPNPGRCDQLFACWVCGGGDSSEKGDQDELVDLCSDRDQPRSFLWGLLGERKMKLELEFVPLVNEPVAHHLPPARVELPFHVCVCEQRCVGVCELNRPSAASRSPGCVLGGFASCVSRCALLMFAVSQTSTDMEDEKQAGRITPNPARLIGARRLSFCDDEETKVSGGMRHREMKRARRTLFAKRLPSPIPLCGGRRHRRPGAAFLGAL